MAAKSRNRIIKSRRDKLHQHLRNFRITMIFLLLAALVLLYKNRVDLWNWLMTYFY